MKQETKNTKKKRVFVPTKFTISHDGSMGRTVYLPIHEWLIFMVCHGSVNIPVRPMDPIWDIDTIH